MKSVQEEPLRDAEPVKFHIIDGGVKKFLWSAFVSLALLGALIVLLEMDKERSTLVVSFLAVFATLAIGFMTVWVSFLQRETAEKQAKTSDKEANTARDQADTARSQLKISESQLELTKQQVLIAKEVSDTAKSQLTAAEISVQLASENHRFALFEKRYQVYEMIADTLKKLGGCCELNTDEFKEIGMLHHKVLALFDDDVLKAYDEWSTFILESFSAGKVDQALSILEGDEAVEFNRHLTEHTAKIVKAMKPVIRFSKI